jgi:SSS family solute:Na+ symporter
MHFDLSKRTFYTVISLGIINWIGIFIGGQNMVQRYVAARSTREARKATILFSVLALSIWTLFFFVGTALFVYYIYFPNPMTAEFEADYVLPHFILSNLPPVVSGIIISAILAAVMSSISSSCNAISTISVIDFMKGWLAKDKSDAHYLKIARLITVLILVLVCLGGVSFNYIEKESMNDISLIVDSVFGGCITGLFIIGLFTGRVDNFSATIAIVFAIAFNIYIGLGLLGLLPSYWTLPIQSYWVGVFVNGVFITLAYIVSVFRTKSFKKPDSLTIWSSSYERGKNSS